MFYGIVYYAHGSRVVNVDGCRRLWVSQFFENETDDLRFLCMCVGVCVCVCVCVCAPVKNGELVPREGPERTSRPRWDIHYLLGGVSRIAPHPLELVRRHARARARDAVPRRLWGGGQRIREEPPYPPGRSTRGET